MSDNERCGSGVSGKRDELRIARKPHRCTLCGERIEAGERYHFTRIAPWDHPDNDGFFSYRAHEECNRFWNEDYGFEFDWELPLDAQDDFRRGLQEAQAAEFSFELVAAE